MHNEPSKALAPQLQNESSGNLSGPGTTGNEAAGGALSNGERQHLPRAIVHDLRNAVAPIRNAVYLLRLRGRDDPALEQISEMIDRQVKEIVRLLNESAQFDVGRSADLAAVGGAPAPDNGTEDAKSRPAT